MTIKVRMAAEADYLRIIPLLEQWILECNPDGYDFEPDAAVIRKTLRDVALSPSGATLVMVDGQQIVGCLGMIKHGWGASGKHTFVSENLWYIHPTYEGYANRMLNAAKRWTKDAGCKYLMFSTNRLSSKRSEKSREWLIKSEFKPLYELFITEVA